MQAIEAHFEAASRSWPMTRGGEMTRDDYFRSFLADEPSCLVPARLLTAERSPEPGQPLFVNPNASFSGGELLIYDSRPENGEIAPAAVRKRIVPEQNMVVLFPSCCLHEVLPVRCHSGEFADSRFTLNGWLHR